MHDAEDALIESGFGLEQWKLIRQYVLMAIAATTLSSIKSAQEALATDSAIQPK